MTPGGVWEKQVQEAAGVRLESGGIPECGPSLRVGSPVLQAGPERNAVPALSISYKLAHRDARSLPTPVVHRCLIFRASISRPPAPVARCNFAERSPAALFLRFSRRQTDSCGLVLTSSRLRPATILTTITASRPADDKFRVTSRRTPGKVVHQPLRGIH